MCLLISLSFLLNVFSPVYAEGGWGNEHGAWQYFDHIDDPHIGWLTYKGKQYYCFEGGFIVHGGSYSGWKEYMPQSDAGFYKIDGNTYAFNKSGAMYKGWFNPAVYELAEHDPNAMDGAYYPYASDDEYGSAFGARLKKFWFYADSSGIVQKGWKQIRGKWYYFDSAFDWFEDDVTKNEYNDYLSSMHFGEYISFDYWDDYWNNYYNTVPYTGITKFKNRMYKCDGMMVTGWQKISGKWYYFKSSGEMVKGWKKIGGKWYYFLKGGSMITGWKKISGIWYYFLSSGAMLADTARKIGKKVYNFDSSGACTNP